MRPAHLAQRLLKDLYERVSTCERIAKSNQNDTHGRQSESPEGSVVLATFPLQANAAKGGSMAGHWAPRITMQTHPRLTFSHLRGFPTQAAQAVDVRLLFANAAVHAMRSSAVGLDSTPLQPARQGRAPTPLQPLPHVSNESGPLRASTLRMGCDSPVHAS